MFQRLGSFILCAFGMLCCTLQAAEQVPTSGGYLDVIKGRGKLVVGIKYDQPPFGLLNPKTNRVEGFDADIGRELAKALLGDASKIEFVEAVTKNRTPLLQAGKVDLVIATMTITDKRKEQIDFSDVYYIAGQTLLVKKGSHINSLKDLKGKTVATAKGSTSEKNIRTLAPEAKVLLFDGYAEGFIALENGQADAVSTDDVILFGLKATAKNPDEYVFAAGQFSSEPYGIGIKKGHPELVKFVNGTLEAMKKDGRWEAIYNKNIKPISGVPAEPPE
jgi:putative glutamine transport system substrate-binding protein